jgi:hypothetical protein
VFFFEKDSFHCELWVGGNSSFANLGLWVGFQGFANVLFVRWGCFETLSCFLLACRGSRGGDFLGRSIALSTVFFWVLLYLIFSFVSSEGFILWFLGTLLLTAEGVKSAGDWNSVIIPQ